MLVDNKHKLFGKLVLKDVEGKPLTMIKSWETETEIAEVYLIAQQDSMSKRIVIIKANDFGDTKAAIVTVKLPGCKLYYRDSGKEVPKEDL